MYCKILNASEDILRASAQNRRYWFTTEFSICFPHAIKCGHRKWHGLALVKHLQKYYANVCFEIALTRLLFLPVYVGGKHWVALCINSVDHTIFVLDSRTPSTRSYNREITVVC